MSKQFNLDFSVDAWLQVNVEAKNSKEARNKLFNMTLEELIENGCVNDFSITNIDIELEEDEELDNLSKTIEDIKFYKKEMEKDLEDQDEQSYQFDKRFYENDYNDIVDWLKEKIDELGIVEYSNARQLIKRIFEELEWEDEDDLMDELIEFVGCKKL